MAIKSAPVDSARFALKLSELYRKTTRNASGAEIESTNRDGVAVWVVECTHRQAPGKPGEIVRVSVPAATKPTLPENCWVEFEDLQTGAWSSDNSSAGGLFFSAASVREAASKNGVAPEALKVDAGSRNPAKVGA